MALQFEQNQESNQIQTLNEWKKIANQFQFNYKQFNLIDEQELQQLPTFQITYKTHNQKQKKERPIEPQQPDPDECCGSGCQRCVLDVYYEQLEQYEKDLLEWITEQDQLDEQ